MLLHRVGIVVRDTAPLVKLFDALRLHASTQVPDLSHLLARLPGAPWKRPARKH